MENLAITSAGRSELTTAFVTLLGIPVADVTGPYPGDTYYAYDPATGTYWAMATFGETNTAPPGVTLVFQLHGQEGLFRRAGSGPWQVKTTGVATFCGELQFFPAAVLTAWALPTTPPAGQTC